MSKPDITGALATAITEALPLGIFLVDTNGHIVYANVKAHEVFGYEENALTGHVVEELIPERFRKTHKAVRTAYGKNPVDIAMSGGRILPGLAHDGSELDLQIGITPLTAQYTLITFIESANEIIKPSSAHDPLTGLPNRRMFDQSSESLRNLAIRNGNDISILFIDLDNVKSVNDAFGHATGDRLICEVATLLEKNLRESDLIARIGGDEFVMCLYGMGTSESLQKLADALLCKISAIRDIDGHTIFSGASIGGIITHKPQATTIETLVSMADKLMYDVKKAGKGAAVVSEI